MRREHKVRCKEAINVVGGRTIDEFDTNFEEDERLADGLGSATTMAQASLWTFLNL